MMKGESALEHELEVFLDGVQTDLKGKALQHLGEITELVQTHRDDQLRLVAEMMVERALGDVRGAGDVARGDAD